MEKNKALGSSFRDPAGFVFQEDHRFYRAVTPYGRQDYELFKSSGLYEALLKKGWIVSHVEETPSGEANVYKRLLPDQIPFISYPYEWCFSQLKDAAILTLETQLLALEYGMSLKDANPFNVQWKGCQPVLIDTLSFETLQERPWFAYRQFCETFLAPLVLMAHVKPDFNQYLKVDLNGVHLGHCSRILPFVTRFSLGMLAHIHLHAWSQQRFKDMAKAEAAAARRRSIRFSKNQMAALVQSLLSFVCGLELKKRKTAFGDYYAECVHYSKEADTFKQNRIEAWAAEGTFAQVLDLGANNGRFSRIFSKRGVFTLSTDFDPSCVEENYRMAKKEKDAALLPLLLDMTNPSPALGWAGEERDAFFKRAKPDLVLALALIHHLRITHNVPLVFLAEFFLKYAPALILEFVPKTDPMAQRLLANRDDVFHDYREPEFEAVFGQAYTILEKSRIPQTQRTLYRLRRR